jgi:IcmF-related N-terminal domain
MLDWAGRVFRWLAGAVVPMFARPTAPVGLAWFLHVVFVIGAAVGLYFAQPLLSITQNITRGPLWFRDFWLPALFLLAYLLTWSAAWLWALLAPGHPTTAFPDLDEAWAEILAAMAKAGIGLADTPMFLVLGEFPAGLEVLFRGLPHGLVVAGGSAPGSPIRAFANRDGIYIAIPGASLLGIQGWIATSDEEGLPFADSMAGSMGVGASIGIDQSVGISMGGSIIGSVGVGAPLHEIQRIVRRAREENRALTEDEKKRIRDLSGKPAPAAHAPTAATSGTVSILKNTRLVAEATARMEHVCGLIAAVRWPLCPVNGAILAVPVAASDRDDSAQQWGLVAREDLARATALLRLNFPVFALLGGVETLPGGATFFERLAAEKGAQRLGKGFPLNPDVSPASVAAEVEKAAGWVFGSLLPYYVFKQMRAESPTDSRENAALFRFLAELRRRSPRLARLVSRAVTQDDVAPVFGGCYLAVATPSDPNDAKFAKEFFKKVESSQAAVAWTEDAYAHDAGYRSMARTGYAMLGLIFLGIVALGGYVAYVHFIAKR